MGTRGSSPGFLTRQLTGADARKIENRKVRSQGSMEPSGASFSPAGVSCRAGRDKTLLCFVSPVANKVLTQSRCLFNE